MKGFGSAEDEVEMVWQFEWNETLVGQSANNKEYRAFKIQDIVLDELCDWLK